MIWTLSALCSSAASATASDHDAHCLSLARRARRAGGLRRRLLARLGRWPVLPFCGFLRAPKSSSRPGRLRGPAIGTGRYYTKTPRGRARVFRAPLDRRDARLVALVVADAAPRSPRNARRAACLTSRSIVAHQPARERGAVGALDETASPARKRPRTAVMPAGSRLRLRSTSARTAPSSTTSEPRIFSV